MDYLRVPQEVTLSEMLGKEDSWSPALYRRIIIPTSNVKCVGELLDSVHPFDKGIEPGSRWYMRHSTHYFVRTKALQECSYLIYPKGDAVIPISPRVFKDFGLVDGDILLSKDSNIGESAMVDGDQWLNCTFSSGIVRLHPSVDRYYLFSFLKHPLFKAQLQAMTARGATITHAKTLWLNCLIPFPSQKDSDKVIQYVSALTQAIVEKEKAIREKDSLIDKAIEQELASHQKGGRAFTYMLPTIKEIQEVGRIDTGMYTDDFKSKFFMITNYDYGYATYEELGFEMGRGQNLQVSCIGKSIYSEEFKPNFYRLIAPTDISEYRTVRRFRYLGNKKPLSLLKKGDVVFGAEGFGKGRVVILADEVQNTITNIHGIVFHPKDGDIIRGIFLGCFLGYLRSIGIIDAIGAGGSGGSLAIGYFHHVPFPKFPYERQKCIARLYHNPVPPPAESPTLDSFVDWHRRWNTSLGIWELDRELKALQRVLANVQEQIIEGKTVEVPI